MKRRLFIGLAVLTVCALAAALSVWRNASGGSDYQGKSVKAWSLGLYLAEPARSEATAALQALGPKAMPPLITMLQTSDSAFHKRLWSLLPKLPPRVRSAVLRRVQPPNAPTARMAAARALGIIGPEARAAVPALARALRDNETGLRWEAAAALGRIGKAAVPALTEAMWDRDVKVRHAAVYALGAVGPDAAAAIPALIHKLKDEDAGVRASAESSLAGIGAPALPALMDLLAHEPGTEREAAARVLLGFYGSRGFVGQSRLNLEQDDTPGTRARAVEKLGAIRPADDVVRKVLLGALRDPAAEVRSAALKALDPQSLKPETLVLTLVGCLRDESPAVREDSAQMLGNLGAPARPAVAILKRLAEDQQDPARAAAQEALRKINPQ